MSKLPPVRRKSQVNRAAVGMTVSRNGAGVRRSGLSRTTGRCHSDQITPRIRLAVRGERTVRNRGSAKPRQPISSPRGTASGSTRKTTSIRAIGARSGAFVQSGAVPPNTGMRATAVPTRRIGRTSTIAYHRRPTRHCKRRRPRSRNPARPLARAATMSATRGPAPNKRSGAISGTPAKSAPTPQERA
jgi:hypothetical protein